MINNEHINQLEAIEIAMVWQWHKVAKLFKCFTSFYDVCLVPGAFATYSE